MNTPSPRIRDLARQLLAHESGMRQSADGRVVEVVKVCEKLRIVIAKLMGVGGFGSLLSRALATAKTEVPSLEAVTVLPDGSMEGFDGIEWDQGTGIASDWGVVLVVQLLDLLVAFIGPSLTLNLVREAWPDATWDGIDTSTGEMP